VRLSDVVDCLTRDVATTVGEARAALVRDAVRHLSGYMAVTDAHFVDRLVEEVQQALHDEFVDITWPACPRHPNHPMWFKDGWWWCEKDEVRVVELGSLASR
jgi:hypothetical protein